MVYLTITEAAKLKSCSRVTIYKWIEEGKLTIHEMARRKYIARDERFEEAKSQREGEMLRVARLEERMAKVEDGNKELRKLLEEILAKVKELEKRDVRFNTKARIKPK